MSSLYKERLDQRLLAAISGSEDLPSTMSRLKMIIWRGKEEKTSMNRGMSSSSIGRTHSLWARMKKRWTSGSIKPVREAIMQTGFNGIRICSKLISREMTLEIVRSLGLLKHSRLCNLVCKTYGACALWDQC